MSRPATRLDPYELATAEFVGAMRNRDSEASGYRAQFGGDRSEQSDRAGAIAELAVAKITGLYWRGMGKRQPADVGCYEVRYSSDPTGPLYVRVRDKPTPGSRYLLVIGDLDGELVIAGGCSGRYAMEKPARDPGARRCPAHIVPQRELIALELRNGALVRAAENGT